jgi:hypothetical protein
MLTGGSGSKTPAGFQSRWGDSHDQIPISPHHAPFVRALRKLQRESAASSFVFVSERGSPFSPAGFAKMIERVGTVHGPRVIWCCIDRLLAGGDRDF